MMMMMMMMTRAYTDSLHKRQQTRRGRLAFNSSATEQRPQIQFLRTAGWLGIYNKYSVRLHRQRNTLIQ